MSEERLLERLSALERAPVRRERFDRGRLLDSILSHLRCMLNTRQGGVPIAPEYGVPDFVDLLQSYPESVREIETSIRRTIERYEPRLERVRVTFLPHEDDRLTLRFHIDAQVHEGGRAAVRFDTALESDGRIFIRR